MDGRWREFTCRKELINILQVIIIKQLDFKGIKIQYVGREFPNPTPFKSRFK